MNKFVLAFISILFFGILHSQKPTQVVGKLENGNPIVTIDKGRAISALTSNLRRFSGLEVQFTDVRISGRDNKYWLIFSGGLQKSTFPLRVEGTLLVADGKVTCTTSECIDGSEGCIPEENVTTGNWICTPCANRGKCTKTVSTQSLIKAP